MATKSKTNNEERSTSPTSDGFVDGADQKLLEEFEESNWKVIDGLADDATPVDLGETLCEKRITRRLTAADDEMFREFSLAEYERTDVGDLFADVHADDRDTVRPDEFEELVVDFPIPETEGVGHCTNCEGSGAQRCGTCNSGGRVQCGSCNGNGVRNDATCGTCGGSGSLVCSSCDGNGRVVCGTCDGNGETARIEFIRRTYTPHEAVTIDAPDVPDEYVRDAEGEYVTTVNNDLAPDEIRNETETREVPVAVLEYEFGGEDYTLYQIEDEQKAESYPMSRTRKFLPIVVGAAVVAVALLFYFGVI